MGDGDTTTDSEDWWRLLLAYISGAGWKSRAGRAQGNLRLQPTVSTAIGTGILPEAAGSSLLG
jgi:hypothetical protein